MFNDWICFFSGHRYQLVQELSPQSRRVCCERCHKSFAMNDDVRAVVPWDSEFHRIYELRGVKIEYQKWELRT